MNYGEPEATVTPEPEAPESLYKKRARAHEALARLESQEEAEVEKRFLAQEQVDLANDALKKIRADKRQLLADVKALRIRKPKPKRGRPVGSKDKAKRVRKGKTGQTEATGEATEASQE